MSQHAQTIPSPHRFTRDEYRRMAEALLFRNERVELLDGVIVTMSPQGSPHAATVHRLLRVLQLAVGSAATVRVQAPIVLNDWSEPEPDIAVCDADSNDYAREHPRADQVHLVVEVADTSLAYDRTQKAASYAASGIPEYWVVDLAARQVDVFNAPDAIAGRYTRHTVVAEAGSIPLATAALCVADILPPA
ncbi:MAG: Uma2 family endonuclease [Deltaproteobacteria bacterium]|nr:Uma2 family endonuclease [Deltaproteobacteria bacterium]MBI3387238.1 Uma2 family endonuclease [Deltaproteobacteria bacterium]